MSCYYCGGQRGGCLECRPKTKDYIVGPVVNSVEIPLNTSPEVNVDVEFADFTQPSDPFHRAVIDAIKQLDPNLILSIYYDEYEQCDILETSDKLTRESLNWSLKAVIITYGTPEDISRNIVRYWNGRRKDMKIPGY